MIGIDQFRDIDLVIDKAGDRIIQRPFVSQGDFDGRTMTVQITDNGAIGRIPGLNVNLYWTNTTSGLTDLTAFERIDEENSIYRITFPNHMLNPGIVKAVIQVVQNGHVINLRKFDIAVQNLDGQPVGVFGTAEYGALVEVLAKANKFETALEEMDIELRYRRINVMWFGAKGDNATDDTDAINLAIASLKTGDQLYFPSGTYLVNANAESILKLKSDITISLHDGAAIKVIPNDKTNYYIFDTFGVENIVFEGGQLIGDKNEHLGTTGEWGHAFEIRNSKDITIRNMTLKNFWGDGIEFGGLNKAQIPKNTVLQNLHILNCRRQGISVCSADGLYAKDILIDTVNGTGPSAGIDFEPFKSDQYIVNCYFDNVKIYNTDGYNILFAMQDLAKLGTLQAVTIDVHLTNIFTDGDNFRGLGFTNFGTEDFRQVVGGKISMNNINISNTRENGITFENWFDNLPSVSIDGIRFRDCGTKTATNYDPFIAAVYAYVTNSAITVTRSAKITFKNVEISRSTIAGYNVARGFHVQTSSASFCYDMDILNYSSDQNWRLWGVWIRHVGQVVYSNPDVYLESDPQDISTISKGLKLTYASNIVPTPTFILPSVAAGNYSVELYFPQGATAETVVAYIQSKGGADGKIIFANPGGTAGRADTKVSCAGIVNHVKIERTQHQNGYNWSIYGTSTVKYVA